MSTQSQSLQKFQDYVLKTKDTDYGLGSVDEDGHYAARLSKTLQSLQNQVQQHEAALGKLRATAHAHSIDEPSQDPQQRLQQLKVVTAAYRSLAPSEPSLPTRDSPLPALLALRKMVNTVDQSKKAITETEANVFKSRERLRQEEADLRDAGSITQALEARIEKLRLDNAQQLEKSIEQSAESMMHEQQQREHHYTIMLKSLMKAFNNFVDEHLAAMLAAEDLGGPVVGDLVEIDEDMLKAGFTPQGKAKKTDADSPRFNAKRTMRNKELWGSKNEDEDEDIDVSSEKKAAQANFRSLIENLLNEAAEKPGSYIKILRESASVRFLVRAKVAQSHPDDARKLRLMDFGREWDS